MYRVVTLLKKVPFDTYSEAHEYQQANGGTIYVREATCKII